MSAPAAAAASGAAAPSLLVVYASHDLDESAALSGEGQGVNKPVVRKRRILDALHAEAKARAQSAPATAAGSEAAAATPVRFEALAEPAPSLQPAERVHSAGLLDLFATGFDRWLALGEDKDLYFTPAGRVNPPDFSELVPSASTCRDPYQRPTDSIHAQVNYYCQDRTTPLTANTSALLHHDLAVTLRAVQAVTDADATEVYACTTQPGHHSGRESYGGYCFINQASLAAAMLQEHFGRVALIDVDYHAGNGSMSILYERSDIFFASIHADPLISYPYTVGFADQTGAGAGAGSTLNVCLGKNTGWAEYAPALQQVLEAVKAFGAKALVVSLGVDTLLADPEAAPLGGFALHGADYDHLGSMVRASGLPTIWVQEGGYKLDEAGDVVRHILLGPTADERAKSAAAK